MQKLPGITSVVGIFTMAIIISSLFDSSAYAAISATGELIGYSESQVTVVEANENTNACASDRVKTTEVRVRNLDGDIIEQVAAGSQVILEATIGNECDIDGSSSFVMILEVRDPDGMTNYLTWQNGTLNPDGPIVVRTSWIAPEEKPGEYDVRAFSDSCLRCSGILMSISETDLAVVGGV